ncbi:hypothetical protein BJ508DRAFT_418408 [Ascobolus immersus RN42]|uniref:Uncharacterized protein n=1 Tax=Ascobolus immersus RN42 TaxID=1160509 RepID=A0A3N4HLW7_ASCIM|nr:hypothetical protein BJ508DRAFT_418408 [Ascobolus immersus RN42]
MSFDWYPPDEYNSLRRLCEAVVQIPHRSRHSIRCHKCLSAQKWPGPLQLVLEKDVKWQARRYQRRRFHCTTCGDRWSCDKLRAIRPYYFTDPEQYGLPPLHKTSSAVFPLMIFYPADPTTMEAPKVYQVNFRPSDARDFAYAQVGLISSLSAQAPAATLSSARIQELDRTDFSKLSSDRTNFATQPAKSTEPDNSENKSTFNADSANLQTPVSTFSPPHVQSTSSQLRRESKEVIRHYTRVDFLKVIGSSDTRQASSNRSRLQRIKANRSTVDCSSSSNFRVASDELAPGCQKEDQQIQIERLDAPVSEEATSELCVKTALLSYEVRILGGFLLIIAALFFALP